MQLAVFGRTDEKNGATATLMPSHSILLLLILHMHHQFQLLIFMNTYTFFLNVTLTSLDF